MEPRNPGQPAPTQVWLTRARDGDEASFAQLYEHIAPSLFTWAQLRIRPEQRHQLDPADLVQEVWLRAWSQADALPTEAPHFRFWVFRIAKNVLLEGLRRGQYQQGIGGPSTRLEQAQAMPDLGTAVSQRLARDESLTLFREQVESLPEDERRLVLHCGLEGLPLAQVAERLGLSVDAVGKRWQRLRARLKTGDLPQYLLV